MSSMSSALKWEKLSSRYLVKEQWATLRVDTCRMPDGTLIDDYYVLEYPNWVNAIALTEEGEVILIRQYRHAAEKVILELPGGCIDPGETPEKAIERELLEETGYQFESLEPLCILHANPSTSANITSSYLARGGRKVQEQHLDGREEIEVLTVNIDEFKDLVLNNQLPQALHASAAFHALLKLGKLG
ncbi:NUDIX hydrolase [Paradesertivirga mongoliensis]|uniref:GDP-mannose pyrophosphatase n=2 Tax=Paradesertivirga mongoliensis TaxID=2100740 RepID=A0ABW4ZGD5_9SPHI|nr:NUDIX hydrolase [Pedobacter mongoliensis]